MNKPARATRLGRLADYLNEMFPPALMVPGLLAHFLAIWLALHALAGRRPAHISWRTVCAALTAMLFALLLRIYDELKDVESDLRLGKAGDPRYRDRAIVTGRVRPEDIRALRNGVIVALVLLNLPLGFPLPLAAFALALALLWLSSRWFFWPAVSRHLLLAFVTHNPLALAISAYITTVFVVETGARRPPPGTLPLLLGFWTLTASWELARKVRHPTQETEYQTYSKLLGPRLAGILPLVVASIGVALLCLVARQAGLSWIVCAIVVAGALPLAIACLRFELAPSPAAANLRPAAELLGVVVSFTFPIALGLQLGIRFW
jgi:4-hydroxybenzoate polyprenyltransferase